MSKSKSRDLKILLAPPTNDDDKNKLHLEEFNSQKQIMGELTADVLENLIELGSGTGGVVYKVQHKTTKTILARKIIKLDLKPASKMQIVRELQILNLCNSSHIVGYFGCFYSFGDINICMEYMDGGSLDLIEKKIGRLPEQILAIITKSVLKGLIYLRTEHQIIHRDIKPSNILLNTIGDVKLCDFGVSGELIDSLANSFVGTRSYMAPERLQGHPYTVDSDIWSLGLSLVELSLGKYPIPPPTPPELEMIFKDSFLQDHLNSAKTGKPLQAERIEFKGPFMSVFESLNNIVVGPPPSLPPEYFSQEFQDFVSCFLKKNPNERSKLKQLVEHPLMEKVDNEFKKEIDLAFWVSKTIAIP